MANAISTAPTETVRGSDGCASPVVAEPPSPSAAASPDWLTKIRDAALDTREYVDLRVTGNPHQSARPIDFAYGGLLGTVLIALNELARPEPDMAHVRDVLMGGYANSQTIVGKLDQALDVLVGIDQVRTRMAAQ